MQVLIRDVAAADRAAWEALWAQYLAFYRVTLAPEVTAQTWARLLDPAAALSGRVAVREGQVAGFALYLHHPSSWVLGEDCYLEDLFVAEAARGAGLGRALIEDLITLARARGCERFYWHTDAGNAAARALYDSFAPSDGHVRYRLAL